MAKRKFDDPLDSIDPIMEQAYSIDEDEGMDEAYAPTPVEKRSKKAEAKPVSRAAAPKSPSKPAPKAAPAPVFPDLDEPDVSEIEFPELIEDKSHKSLEVDVFSNIPIKVSVELGRSEISLKEVFELTEGSIIELERLVGEPLDLVVNGQVIAQGEVVAIDNNYGLRITNIVAHLQR